VQALNAQNQKTLRRMVVTLKATVQRLELAVGICDDRDLRSAVITAYEAQLQQAGIRTFQVQLAPNQHSLRASLRELFAREVALQAQEPAVVTVLNAEALRGVRLEDEKSDQERFFYSLQWTREALLRFEIPVVLWVSSAMAQHIGRKAPDFWSWRGGVFEFVAGAGQKDYGAAVQAWNAEEEIQAEASYKAGRSISRSMDLMSPVATDETALGESPSIEALQRQIENLRAASPESSLLITLYNDLGEAYAREGDHSLALRAFETALEQAKSQNNWAGQMRSLTNLGHSLHRSGSVQQAIEAYTAALEISRQVGDRQGEADAFGHLGQAYLSLRNDRLAIVYFEMQVAVAQQIGYNLVRAAALGNLGKAHNFLGAHQRAIGLYEQQLAISRQMGDRLGEANAFSNLGQAYLLIEQYEQAIAFYQQQLAIALEMSDRLSQANAYFNLALTYSALKQKEIAKKSFEAAQILFESLTLPQRVEACKRGIQSLISLP
jgi:tetratricopeptide (TPR) repeat protein